MRMQGCNAFKVFFDSLQRTLNLNQLEQPTAIVGSFQSNSWYSLVPGVSLYVDSITYKHDNTVKQQFLVRRTYANPNPMRHNQLPLDKKFDTSECLPPCRIHGIRTATQMAA